MPYSNLMFYNDHMARFRHRGVWGRWHYFAEHADESWRATGWDPTDYEPEDTIDPTDYTEGAD